MSFNLAQNHTEPLLPSEIEPIFYGGLCATLTYLLLPQTSMHYYQQRLLNLIFSQLSDIFI